MNLFAPERPAAKHFDKGILVAAIKSHYVLYTLPRPARHHTIMHDASFKRCDCAVHTDVCNTQGFVTHEGHFVGRVEAGKIAIRYGQIDRLNWPPNLYSEDLW